MKKAISVIALLGLTACATWGHPFFASQHFMQAMLVGRHPMSDANSAAVRYSLIIFFSPVLCDWIDSIRY